MTDHQDTAPLNHNRGIITPIAIQSLNTFLEKNDNKALIKAVKVEEPNLLGAIKTAVDDATTYFIDSGVGPKTVSLIRDACFTCMLRGALLYREAVRQWDAKKLDEMYKLDFEAWEDKLIDQYLESKKVAASGKI